MAQVSVPLEKQARAGKGRLPGMVWRPGDAAKHLGPPEGLMPTWVPTFSTRCGIGPEKGPWQYTEDEDDVWCSDCLRQGMVPYELWTDYEKREGMQ